LNKWAFLTKIHIHPLFWVVAVIGVVTAHFQDIIVLFTIVFIHELGHAIVASYYSWRIRRIMLLPFGGMAEVDEHGNRPLKEEAFVILAGPIQHFWLFLLAFFLHDTSLISDGLFEKIWNYNWMILLFNCLPILPLDGGKLMLLFFANFWPYLVAMKRSLFFSLLFLLGYACSLLYVAPLHFNGWLIVGFLGFSIYNEWKEHPYIFIRFLLERYEKREERELIPTEKRIRASVDDSVSEVIKKFQRGKKHAVIVYEGRIALKKLKESTLLEAFFDGNSKKRTIFDLLS